ncbi:hypothetical protein [Nonomuraea sp. NPDC046570]|uniref:hypothetical protein n=1 Tax=Nonomuraea sp. NPDC046570 TaxID=3155255 RepID=UPI0033D7B877
MARTSHIAPRTGILLAFTCLLLLGLMPVISNGRPAGASALTFALIVSVWQLLFSLPLQIREWRSGERGLFRKDSPPMAARRLVAITLFTEVISAK